MSSVWLCLWYVCVVDVSCMCCVGMSYVVFVCLCMSLVCVVYWLRKCSACVVFVCVVYVLC